MRHGSFFYSKKLVGYDRNVLIVGIQYDSGLQVIKYWHVSNEISLGICKFKLLFYGKIFYALSIEFKKFQKIKLIASVYKVYMIFIRLKSALSDLSNIHF